tara:strand:- start:14336 stop:14962 length:627 start_codon:yes stop_codon:yes gene_type:complete
MDIKYDYVSMSESFKDMVNSIIDKIHIAMNTKTVANRYLMSWYELSAYKAPTFMDYILMLLVYHRGEIMFHGLNKLWYNHAFTKVHNDYPIWKGDDFGKDIKVYLTGDMKDKKFQSNYLLICNNLEGAWIPLSNFRLINPLRTSLTNKLSLEEFKNKFITKLHRWNGDSPTPKGWGLDRLYDITDIFTTEINMLGFINWPLEEPKELI